MGSLIRYLCANQPMAKIGEIHLKACHFASEVAQSADLAGISQQKFYDKMKKHGISRSDVKKKKD